MGRSPITEVESRILVYLVPDAHDIRRQGRDVFMGRPDYPGLNRRDFWFWTVTDPSGPAIGSAMVGSYGVNVHTGKVLVLGTYEEVHSRELKGVQKILREEHHIDAHEVEAHDEEVMLLPE